jgi:hypothetical protein
MCLLQCPCGMVVSTRRCQTRCIRCGAILGASDLMAVPGQAPAEATKPVEGECHAETAYAATPAGASGAGHHAALAKYVSLVIIAAARSLCERGDGT